MALLELLPFGQSILYMKKNLFNVNWLFIGCFWLILGIAIWAQMIHDFALIPAILHAFSILFVSVIIAHTLSDILLPKALAEGKMKLFVVQSISMTLLSSFLLMAISMWFYNSFIQGTALETPERLESYGSWVSRWYSVIPSAILINGTACGLRFYQEHNRMEKDHAQLQQVHLEAQLRILQDQINPHLMFNVLNHIHILMKKDVELASMLLIRFSDILRYQLYECNREFVTLEKELKYLKDLVAVEQIRWGNELDVVCNWTVQNAKSQISPLLLVPFVENAFKHVSRLPTENGYVHLSLKQKDKLLELSIENSNSVQLPRKHEGQGIGLENVKKRLDILYPSKHELHIEKTASIFKIHLQLELPIS